MALPPASVFGASWAAYQPFSHNGLCPKGDDATDAWVDEQLIATAALADAPARTTSEMAKKLAAALYWFEESSASTYMADEEADLLRSCLRDLRAMA